MDKANLCRMMAGLLYPIDNDMLEMLQTGKIYRYFSQYFNGIDLTALDNYTGTIESNAALYRDCFETSDICLSESTFKKWTDDPDYKVGISESVGLLMGDCSLHMLELYKTYAIDIPDEFRSQPDHLALELEFLSNLYDNYSDIEVSQFINDHLLWVSDLIMRCVKNNVDVIYLTVLEIINSFIIDEKNRLRQVEHII
jgi:hypothetical protein